MQDVGQLGWTPLLEERRIADGELVSANLDGTPVVVARDDDGQVFAFADICPHRSAPLSDGDIEDGRLICASHGWVFDLDSGASTEPPGHQLKRFPCRLADGWVQVGIAPPDVE